MLAIFKNNPAIGARMVKKCLWDYLYI